MLNSSAAANNHNTWGLVHNGAAEQGLSHTEAAALCGCSSPT